MAAWKKPFRNLLRWFRRQTVISESIRRFKIPEGVGRILSDGLVGLLVSIIPGLAHLIKGRFKEIRLLFIAWLILLSTGLFLYGSSTGFILLGLAIGVHAWIGLQYGLFKELSRMAERIVVMLIIVLVLILVYRAALGAGFFGLTGNYSSLTIPYYNIQSGDYLLARRIANQENQIPRGTVVLFHPVEINTQRRVSRGSDITAGEIIGLPGEVVEIKNGVFLVNDQKLNPEKFPVPNWLRNRQVSVTVANDSYFVSSQYDVTIGGRASVTNQHIIDTCVIKASDIEAQAFMRWWPIRRRGFIR
jgi:hypothetical protein